MRAPDFWNNRGLISTLLLPASLFYKAGGFLRQKLTKPVKVKVPVICIGNLSAGGTGKTPITRSIADILTNKGYTPHIVTRGYGGTERGPIQVQYEKHKPTEVGDEPLMLSSSLPTWVSRDRVLGAEAAIAAGADILLLDDGFQNPKLFKDLSFIIVDANLGFANGRVIPAGPLRETIPSGANRADAVVLMNSNSHLSNQEISSHLAEIPVLHAQVEPVDASIAIKGKSVFAFAAIGYPQKFYSTLEQQRAVLSGTKDFPDHHQYTRSELHEIIKTAENLGAELILTTEKDYTKIPEDFRNQIHCLPIRAVWDNPNNLMDVINKLPGIK
ncbi:tetraacyldisaccharide 4'-kinase [Kiloniella sp.]|uniref:tetraacyldisaccharide 4'-kinase n=1 Tax=Kiloniella sp. TaxID=1938587 RepID=UPI003B013B37